MTRFTAAALAVGASMSFAALAEEHPPPFVDPNPTGQPPAIVRIEYWGSITNVIEGQRSVGDRVHNIMRIDTRLSPPDQDDFARSADYMWNQECERNCPPDLDALSFLSTGGGPVNLAGPSYDRVIFRDGDAVDSLFVHDQEFAQWDGLGDYFTAQLDARSAVNFISGDGLVLKDVDLKKADDPSLEASGNVSSFLGGVFDAFEYALDRVRVTSKVCRM